MSIVASNTLIVKSPAFADNDFIPAKYTCVGENINPELSIKDIPKEAKSLVLIVDDPDSAGQPFDHWIMWEIPVKDKIAENSKPGIEGKNGFNENKYAGPCPSSGTHHYHFRVYALKTKLELPSRTTKTSLLKAMDGNILATGELIGLFKK
jgi:Raf kinase inhibitor-like YbhB/YbcL family protein